MGSSPDLFWTLYGNPQRAVKIDPGLASVKTDPIFNTEKNQNKVGGN
jgi:hypothetical protein